MTSAVTPTENAADPPAFEQLPDLAARSYGGAVIHANDDFFADRAALVTPGPVRSYAEFGYRGKVYDGWETRRRRTPGHDHAVVRLGIPGIVEGVIVDTSYFVGNYPPEVSIEAASFTGHPNPDELAAAEWTTLVPRSAAAGGTPNRYPVSNDHRWTHVRLSIYPDGGVARLRVHGRPVPDPALVEGTIDLAAPELGGRVVDCSNMFFSSPANVLLPGPARNMGEGWENARRRTGGNDWMIVGLAGQSTLRAIVFDTSHYLGNAPGELQISAAGLDDDGQIGENANWTVLVPRRPVRPDTIHRLSDLGPDPVTHLRLDVFPDGGFARLRVLGALTEAGRAAVQESWSRSRPPIVTSTSA